MRRGDTAQDPAKCLGSSDIGSLEVPSARKKYINNFQRVKKCNAISCNSKIILVGTKSNVIWWMSVIISERAERCNSLKLISVMRSSAPRSVQVLDNMWKPNRVVEQKIILQRPNRVM